MVKRCKWSGCGYDCDCEERRTCDKAGEFGHRYCGARECGCPKFIFCDCPKIPKRLFLAYGKTLDGDALTAVGETSDSARLKLCEQAPKKWSGVLGTKEYEVK